MSHVYAPESGYKLAGALASAKTAPKPEPNDDAQASAENAYLQKFSAGEFASDVTFAYGRATRSEHGAVVSVTPTAEDLHRHARLHGSGCVADTARAFGGKQIAVTAAPRSTAKRHRRTTPNLREQVLALHARGLVASAIADTLNVADRRVREILKAA
jgi:hypothetical protein